MSTSALLLSTKKQEEEADALFAAVSNIGHSIQVEPEKETAEGKHRRSRFFYKPTLSFKEDIEQRKKISLPKEVQIVDKQIEDRKASYKDELPPLLNKNIEGVREFWLKEIAPLTLAAQAGSEQAKDVVQRILDAPIDETPFARFHYMLTTATSLKMARFISKYFKLPLNTAQTLIDSVQPRREIVFPSVPEDRAPKKTANPSAENLKELKKHLE